MQGIPITSTVFMFFMKQNMDVFKYLYIF